MNINYSKPKARQNVVANLNSNLNLNESQQQQQNFNEIKPQQDSLELAKILTNENNFYKFSNGKYLIKLDVPTDSNGKLSLKWHLENSLDFDEFIQSINDFLHCELPESDVEKLRIIYDNYVGV